MIGEIKNELEKKEIDTKKKEVKRGKMMSVRTSLTEPVSVDLSQFWFVSRRASTSLTNKNTKNTKITKKRERKKKKGKIKNKK